MTCPPNRIPTQGAVWKRYVCSPHCVNGKIIVDVRSCFPRNMGLPLNPCTRAILSILISRSAGSFSSRHLICSTAEVTFKISPQPNLTDDRRHGRHRVGFPLSTLDLFCCYFGEITLAWMAKVTLGAEQRLSVSTSLSD